MLTMNASIRWFNPVKDGQGETPGHGAGSDHSGRTVVLMPVIGTHCRRVSIFLTI
ncbi:hypothetical protein TRVA0_001S09736 [Trichomonascus vanleenenianus]|uniref:uncharacterized protein n=1 Tax=Trichomonascus vanleenenianus TaxID=2268995 RepID=UPI003ECB0CD2